MQHCLFDRFILSMHGVHRIGDEDQSYTIRLKWGCEDDFDKCTGEFVNSGICIKLSECVDIFLLLRPVMRILFTHQCM